LPIAVNLMTGGLILFCCLVIGAALPDKWRAGRPANPTIHRDQAERARQPHAGHRSQKLPGNQQTAAFSR